MREDRSRAPFNAVWFAPNELFEERRLSYDKLIIDPVRTDFLEEQIAYEERNDPQEL